MMKLTLTAPEIDFLTMILDQPQNGYSYLESLGVLRIKDAFTQEITSLDQGDFDLLQHRFVTANFGRAYPEVRSITTKISLAVMAAHPGGE